MTSGHPWSLEVFRMSALNLGDGVVQPAEVFSGDGRGRFDRSVAEGTGDITAIEGTRVTLTAEANLPIANAEVDLGADGRCRDRLDVGG